MAAAVSLSSVLIFMSVDLGLIYAQTSFRASAPGDIIIGGIFPLHEDVERNGSFTPDVPQCVRFLERGLVRALAMVNAVETVNASPALLQANITLGYVIRDSCSDVSTGLRAVSQITEQSDCSQISSTSGRSVSVLIGAAHSEMSIAIARQLTLTMIPQISYSSTAVILSDKTRFPSFLRTIPNDQHQTAGMVRLLSGFGWNWVGVVTTDGDYGRSALDNFASQASEKGICVAFRSILPGSVTSQDIRSAIRRAAVTVYNNPKVNVIVSFAKPTLMMYLLQELKKQTLAAGDSVKSMKRVWVASDSWSSSHLLNEDLSLDEIGHVVGFHFKTGDLTSFDGFLSRIETEETPHLKGFSGMLRGFKDGDGAGSVESLRQNLHGDSVFSVEMAVSAVAQAAVALCRNKDCKTPGAVQPWQLLKALRTEDFKLWGKSYKFDESGDINLGYDVSVWRSHRERAHVHDVVAEYHPNNNSFTYTEHSSAAQLLMLKDVVSKCSNSCVPGEFKKTAEGQHTCCYECINCTENYYSNDTDMDQCLSCDPDTEWAPGGSAACIPKQLLYFCWDNAFAIVLLTFASLGILLALLTSALFFHRRHTPVARAAGGPLSQVILFSLVVSFVSATLFVGEPNGLQCKARQVLFGISFTLCVSCILVKSLQILLAFHFDPALQEMLRKLYQPYVIVSVCVALQVATCICWLVLKSPFTYVVKHSTTLLQDCHEGSYLAFGVMLGYIALLAFVCFICAFKGRKLPQQYNEAKFITFSMLLYLISWLLFVPVYVTTSGVYLPAVEMVVILISNYGILSCHFFPKCYVMLFKKEQNTRSAFRKTLYEYTSKNSSSFSASESSESGGRSVQSNAEIQKTEMVTGRSGNCIGLNQDSTKQRTCLRRSTSI